MFVFETTSTVDVEFWEGVVISKVEVVFWVESPINWKDVVDCDASVEAHMIKPTTLRIIPTQRAVIKHLKTENCVSFFGELLLFGIAKALISTKGIRMK
jgi:hypothetical protein